ncbi:phage holin family protein [Ectothiorhodospiraceae bacterium 2226]|nr:phage holin family protein [Ectothiorhodospiraceae bacterium 2226]
MRVPEFLSLEVERAKQKAVNIATGSAIALVGAVIALLAVAFLYVAIFLGFAEIMDAAWAAAATAAVALVSALLLLVAARGLITKEPKVEPPPPPRKAIPDMREEAAELGSAAGEYARHHAVPATAGALAAGLLFGVSPRLRRMVWRLLQ